MNREQTAHVPTGTAWFTSSYSSEQGGDCVEVALGPGAVRVRDSKDPGGGTLSFPTAAWAEFVAFAAVHGEVTCD